MTASLKWSTFAGGTAAAPGKHGHSAHPPQGTYQIQPISNRWGRHKGYLLHFINDKGRLPGGLWQELGMFASPNLAKGAANRHYQQHFGSRR